MDLHEAIYTTRSMRRLKPDPVPLEVQARILDAAIRAPSEPDARRFVLVDDPAVKAQIAPLYLAVWEAMALHTKLHSILRSRWDTNADGACEGRHRHTSPKSCFPGSDWQLMM